MQVLQEISPSVLHLILTWIFQLIAVIPDTNTPALTYYTLQAEVPNVIIKHGVVQVVYNTNNPNAPPSFYQCADFGTFQN